MAPAPAGAPPAGFAVGIRILRFVDPSRHIRVHGRNEARTLPTYLFYPAAGARAGRATANAPIAGAGPLPLIVFAHGFAVTPAPYRRLLEAWARAGFLVAAPVFPLENANAPGGPDEEDLVNEPADISFVISSLIAEGAAPAGPLSGHVDPAKIAVAGQSDGGEAALALAYSRRLRDGRIGAAIVLSGAEISGIGGYRFAGGPPLLASQGTADTFNEPRYTYAYFRAARRPKYLLRLLGAGHLPPYARQQPQLGIVERVSTAFLDLYLRGEGTPQGLLALGDAPRTSTLTAEP